MIGGKTCSNPVAASLIVGEEQTLSHHQLEVLWLLFQEIGKAWNDVYNEGANLRSSWLELIHAKSSTSPSYTGEYVNAVYVLNELIEIYGNNEAFRLLLFAHGIPDGPPLTRLAHAKTFVVNEFIRMQVIAGGFKHFGGDEVHHKNYKGFIKGSRYNRRSIVRTYIRKPGDEA